MYTVTVIRMARTRPRGSRSGSLDRTSLHGISFKSHRPLPRGIATGRVAHRLRQQQQPARSSRSERVRGVLRRTHGLTDRERWLTEEPNEFEFSRCVVPRQGEYLCRKLFYSGFQGTFTDILLRPRGENPDRSRFCRQRLPPGNPDGGHVSQLQSDTAAGLHGGDGV